MIIIKLGGSILSKSEETIFDFSYAHKLKLFLNDLLNEDSISISTGGGYLSRKFMNLVEKKGEEEKVDIHRVGIAATNMNVELLHGVLDEIVFEKIYRYSDFERFLNFPMNFSLTKKMNGGKNFVLLSSPSEPGYSNDWNALQIALKMNERTVYSLKNVDGVYDSDPKINQHAKRFDSLSWDEYLDIIGNPETHEPGMSYPVDPKAARLAKESGLKFIIIDGNDLENFRKSLKKDKFIGTLIS